MLRTVNRSVAILAFLLVGAWLLAKWGGGNLASEQLTRPNSNDAYNPILTSGTYRAPNPFYLLSPDAHIALTEQALLDNDQETAKQHVLTALSNNPASGRAAAALLTLYRSLEDPNKANQAAELAEHLWPRHSAIRFQTAQYWLEQENLPKAIPAWAILLERHPSLSEELFPLFHRALDDPQLYPLMKPYVQNPPGWWEAFFRYLLEKEAATGKAQHYYQLRQQAATPIAMREREIYIHYLLKQQQWQAAYDVWQASLPSPPTANQWLYDGGFENETFPASTFGWNIQQGQGIKIRPDTTVNITGKAALHISLQKGKSVRFTHISQIQVLPAGNYTFEARYRLDDLRTPKGLRWRIHCLGKDNTEITSTLTESEPMKGQSDWKNVHLDFSIPASGECVAQMLRLEADSQYAHDNIFEGSLWFDDLSIQQHP